jgi:hypothetical protein
MEGASGGCQQVRNRSGGSPREGLPTGKRFQGLDPEHEDLQQEPHESCVAADSDHRAVGNCAIFDHDDDTVTNIKV